MPDILGIIPARGGSKRVPGKNLRKLHGKTLVEYAIQAALHSRLITELVLSSDNAEILTYGAKVKDKVITILRPENLSADDSPAIEYVNHALGFMHQYHQKIYDYIVIIQPSSPLTRGADIDNTIQIMLDFNADCAVSIREVPHDLNPSKYHYLMDNKLQSFLTASQQEQLKDSGHKFYVRNGSVYVSSKKLIDNNILLSDNCAAYIMPAEHSVDINDELDLAFAEFLLQRSPK